VARYVLSYYYRNIDVSGLENIPQDAPVILAANHPTGFIEPCILACFQPRALHFLARGSVFVNTFYNQLLAAVNILPVFRLEDGGYERLKENFSTFEACFRALSRKQAIMIMAEGRCIHEKALRPLRKGTARIALGALDQDATLQEVYIVPVGINFTHAAEVRSTVMIRCGKPILASDYLKAYRQGEAAAIKSLTQHLRSRLSPLVVQFPNRDVADIGESLLAFDRALHPIPQGITNNGHQLNRELEIATNTPTEDPPLLRLFNRLKAHKLPIGVLLGQTKKHVKKSRFQWAKAWLSLLLLLPQLPLWGLGEYIGASRPRHIEFYSPVRFAVITGGTLLLYPFALFLLSWPLKVWLLSSIFLTNWSLRQLESIQWWWQNRKLERMVAQDRKALQELLSAIEKPLAHVSHRIP
ncbi:MAG: 1-acyl-sn-glycerol-3-phosphate acyltransferase, partial [Bacteroidota bacterium]